MQRKKREALRGRRGSSMSARNSEMETDEFAEVVSRCSCGESATTSSSTRLNEEMALKVSDVAQEGAGSASRLSPSPDAENGSAWVQQTTPGVADDLIRRLSGGSDSFKDPGHPAGLDRDALSRRRSGADAEVQEDNPPVSAKTAAAVEKCDASPARCYEADEYF